MRICIIGDCAGNIDEGMKKAALHLSQELSQNHQVLLVNPRRMLSKSFWKDIKGFNPQIVHYIPGPSIISFVIVKAVASYCKNSRTVMSAMHPAFYGLRGFSYSPYNAFSSIFKPLIPLFKPNLILVQSPQSEKMFTKLGCKTQFLPNGVDTEKFIPASNTTKKKLRKKYGIGEGNFVILHIGSIKRWRNVGLLRKLQKQNNQVLIIGSTSTGRDKGLCQHLQQEGCLIWTGYVENIEEVYALSDCYVFPTMDDRIGSIEMPLSILEAMSCNLPVISTRFGALPKVFEEGNGLIFAQTEEEIHQGIETIRDGNIKIKTRKKALVYSWESVAKELGEIYEQMAA